MDPAAVAQTIGGTDAVLSTLGATATDHPHTRRTGTQNIINVMRDSDVDRLVVMGGFHVHAPGEDGNVGQKLVVPFLHLSRVVVADTTGIGALVLASNLDWTLVRSPRVVAGALTGTPRTGTLRLGPWSKATRGDVAQLMLRCASDRLYLRQAPMVSSSWTRTRGLRNRLVRRTPGAASRRGPFRLPAQRGFDDGQLGAVITRSPGTRWSSSALPVATPIPCATAVAAIQRSCAPMS